MEKLKERLTEKLNNLKEEYKTSIDALEHIKIAEQDLDYLLKFEGRAEREIDALEIYLNHWF